MSRNTIARGLRDLDEASTGAPVQERIRRPSRGRKRADAKDAGLLPALESLVAPATRGDPMPPLCWTSKSTAKLAQELANDIGKPITVCHFPPGTSKWNRTEHRLFSHITMNWRGKPLITHEVMISLIAATTTKTELKVRSELDRSPYPAGRKIKNREMTEIKLAMAGPTR